MDQHELTDMVTDTDGCLYCKCSLFQRTLCEVNLISHSRRIGICVHTMSAMRAWKDVGVFSQQQDALGGIVVVPMKLAASDTPAIACCVNVRIAEEADENGYRNVALLGGGSSGFWYSWEHTIHPHCRDVSLGYVSPNEGREVLRLRIWHALNNGPRPRCVSKFHEPGTASYANGLDLLNVLRFGTCFTCTVTERQMAQNAD